MVYLFHNLYVMLEPVQNMRTLLSSLLASKLLGLGYVLPRLKTTFKKFYGRHHNFVDIYDKPMSQMVKDIFTV